MKEEFADNSKNYKTLTDLTEKECAALDALGELLPELLRIPTNLAPNTKLSACFVDLCGFTKGKANYDTGLVLLGASLYTPGEQNGFERVPCITFSYCALQPGSVYRGEEDVEILINFMPAYLCTANTTGNTNRFIPIIVKAPDDINTINCADTRNILNFARTYMDTEHTLTRASGINSPPPPAPGN